MSVSNGQVMQVERGLHFLRESKGECDPMLAVHDCHDGMWLCAHESGLRRDAMWPVSEKEILASRYLH